MKTQKQLKPGLIFKDPEFKKSFWSLMIPIAVQEVLLVLVSTIGSILLGLKGAIGETAKSGVGLANNVFFFFNTTSLGFTIVCSFMFAQFYGKQDRNGYTSIFNLGMKIVIIYALIFFALSLAIPRQLCWLYGQTATEEQLKIGTDYLRIFSPAFLLQALTLIYIMAYKNVGKRRNILFVSLGALVLNIGLCSAFIFGTDMLGNGVAIGVIVARLFETICYMVLVRKTKVVGFSWKYFWHTQNTIFKAYFKYLVPILGCRIILGVGQAFASIFMGKLGADIISANTTFLITKNLVVAITNGASNAASVLLGHELGANHLDKAKQHGNQIMLFTLFLALFNAAVYFGLSGMMFAIFRNNTPITIFWIITGIYAASILIQPYNGVCMDGIYAAGGDTLYISILNVSASLFVLLLGIAVFYGCRTTETSPEAIRLSLFFIFTGDELIKGPANLLRYRRNKWVKNVVNNL